MFIIYINYMEIWIDILYYRNYYKIGYLLLLIENYNIVLIYN